MNKAKYAFSAASLIGITGSRKQENTDGPTTSKYCLMHSSNLNLASVLITTKANLLTSVELLAGCKTALLNSLINRLMFSSPILNAIRSPDVYFGENGTIAAGKLLLLEGEKRSPFVKKDAAEPFKM